MKTQSSKKGWALVLTLAMVFTTLFGGFGFLGVKGMVGEAYAVEDVEWSNGTSLGNITVTDGAIVNVSGTVTLTGIITISGNATITGSGIIQAKSDFSPARMIDVPAGSTLTISGVTMDANNRNTRGIELAGTLNMEGSSKILNCAAVGSSGGTAYAVNINGTGEFNMHDSAEIRGCKHGGVHMNGSNAFNMNDNAIITDCEVGVGVWVNHTTGSFHMADNAKISDCHSGDGGGVYSVGTVIMSEYAEISNCTANFAGGGGLCIGAGTFSMLDNAKISSCSSISTGAYHGGGGIRIGSAIFNMSGGTIENCTSATYGGGMHINGSTLNLSDGIIQNCEAPTGGGIAIGSFNPEAINVSGSTKIVNNTISGTAISSNIQLKAGCYVQIAGSGLTTGAILGITPVTSPTGSANVSVVTSTASHTVSAADAAYFNADSSAHFITYSSIVADNALLLVANEWTPPVKNGTPTAIFNASNMTLSNLTTAMQYSEDGGGSWNWVAASSISMSGVTTANGIKVKEPGNGGMNTIDSDIQTINLTQAASVSAGDFNVSQPAMIGGTATIGGITVAMQYSTNGGSSWTNGNGSNIGNIAGGTTVQIRNKGIGTTLAGVTYSIAITTFSSTSESTPNAVVNYFSEKLTGLSVGATYKINGTEYTADGSGNITIAAVWYGTNLSIVKKGNSITTTDSTAQTVALAARPGTPVVGQFVVTHPAIPGGTGTISGITNTMEYSTNSGVSWTPGSGNDVAEIDGTIVTIRVKATGTAPVSLSYNITLAPVTYALTISGGGIGATANGSYVAGALSINAGTMAGYNFSGWTSSGGGIFANASLASTTYAMPANDTTITANWTIISGGGSGGSGGGSGSGGSGGGGGSSTPATGTTTNIAVNGKSETAGTVLASKDGNKTVTTVTVDDKKIQEKINAEGSKSTVSIPISGSSDIGQGVLNGQTIKDMEKKESILEIKTGLATYSLPASEINIDSVSSEFGKAVKLEDIKISVKIAETSADKAKIVQDEANKNNYQVVVKPVDFEITCTSGSKTITVSKFNGYVERVVAIPDGIDPSKVTTGVVLNKDGTFSHVPTTIVKIEGKYYAKINSLTNSTYSLIYNPIEFVDVAKHWAKESVNEMGSRLVISGVGENKFEPNRDITRAEFAAIMVRALGLAPDSTKNKFSDVEASKWYSGYVGTAASYGIISGYEGNNFAPNAKINREQAMTMVARAMAITDLDIKTAGLKDSQVLSTYSDAANISNYAKVGIMACINTGVVTGKTENTIAPKSNITRAEVAVIIQRLLEKSELI